MNNSNELDQLVESFLQPKKSTTLGLKELFALFEEVQKITEIQTSFVVPSSEKKSYEQEHESIALFYKMYNETLASGIPEGSDPIDKIQNFIKFVDELKEDKINKNVTLSNSLAAMIFTSSLHKLIEDFIPDQPQSAGFFFEKFMNLLFKSGKVQIENETDKLPIDDLQVDMGGKTYFLSLKLIKGGSITGSIGNILKFFGNKHNKTYKLGNHNFSLINFKDGKPIALADAGFENKEIIYVIATKPPKQTGIKEQRIKQPENSIRFNMFQFNFQQFLNMLGEQNARSYNDYLLDPSSDEKQQLKMYKQEFHGIETDIERFEYLDDALKRAEVIEKELIPEIESKIEQESESDEFLNPNIDQPSDENVEFPSTSKTLEKLIAQRAKLNIELRNIETLLNKEDKNLDMLNKLTNRKEELKNLIIKSSGSSDDISSSKLKFSISTKKLEQNNNKFITDLFLSLRANERDTILTQNKKVFDEKINIIIEEANTISYKVNNYLLSVGNTEVTDQERNDLAQKAYTSAVTLQTNLGSKTGIAPVDNKPK